MDTTLEVTEFEINRAHHIWQIHEFALCRELAKLNHLALHDHMDSRSFGSEASGYWKLIVYPYGAAIFDSHANLSVLVASQSETKCSAKYRITILNNLGEFVAGHQNYNIKEFSSEGTPLSMRGIGKCLQGKDVFQCEKDLQTKLFDGSLILECEISRLSVGSPLMNSKIFNISKTEKNLFCRKPCTALPITSFNTMYKANALWRDVIFNCNGFHFESSKYILSAQSEVFHNMFINEYAHGKAIEIEIEDLCPSVLGKFLDVLNTGIISKEVFTNLRLLICADRYDARDVYERLICEILRYIDDSNVRLVMKVGLAITNRLLVISAHNYLKKCNGLDVFKGIKIDKEFYQHCITQLE